MSEEGICNGYPLFLFGGCYLCDSAVVYGCPCFVV